jgi:predicted PurR-regulated permease PerM
MAEDWNGGTARPESRAQRFPIMDVSLSPRARTVIMWVGVIVGLFILLEAAHALKPFAWAIITAYIFHPFVSFIHRKTRLPKHLITTWLYLMMGLVITILAINLVPPLVDQVKKFQDQTPEAVTNFQTWLDENQSERMAQLGLESNFLETRINEVAANAADMVSTAAVPFLLGTFSVAIKLLVYLVASFYFIVYGDRFVMAIRNALNRRYHREFDRLMLDINSTLGAYIRGQVLLVFIMAIASFLALTILDLEYALLVAIATGFLELIPLIGPWTAAAIAVTVSLFQDTTPFGWSHGTLAIVIALVYFGLRQLEDTFVIPMVIGRIVHLHPLFVIFVLVVGTALGGVLGLILAVPMAAVLKILATFFYAKLMAREVRHIEVIGGQEDLERIGVGFEDMVNGTVVLLVEPGALEWRDLDLVRNIANLAMDSSVALSAVTPDAVAGSLMTAVGIPTSAIAASLPVAMEPFAR